MKTKIITGAVHLLLISWLVLAGCNKENKSNFDVTADVRLQSFSINQQQGEIDHKSGIITVRLPFGTNLSSLTPSVALPATAALSPAAGATINFTGDVKYRITNGNLYKDYTVKALITPPLKSFTINGVAGTIDQSAQSITVLLPDGVNLSNLTPQIQVENNIQVSPASGVPQNFTGPVSYTLTSGNTTATYRVTVISNSVNEYAFLGLAATRDAIADPDEKAAADWFFLNYPAADYISFQSIETGRRLSNYKVIWWHYDAAQDLPAAALTSAVVNALKAYRANGGNLMLTTYATRYVEALGIVPQGRGPNNAFGDFGNAGFIEQNNNWGISFRTRESHPVFAGIETYEPGKAWLLEKGTFRQNHTAWWFLPEWGGYGNGAAWREQTGGINLASEAWDDNLDGRVGIAEWKTGDNANVIIIAFGAYDWYSEPLNGGKTTNAYIGNIRRITKNAIDYLKDH
jgi:hypothetical protein